MRQVVAAAAVLLVAACGGDAGGPTGEIKDVIQSYGDALADGDGPQACSLVTRDLRDQIVEATGARSCEEAVRAQADVLTADQRDSLHIDSFRRITITKAGASAEIADAPIEVLLVKTRDGWRISSFAL